MPGRCSTPSSPVSTAPSAPGPTRAPRRSSPASRRPTPPWADRTSPGCCGSTSRDGSWPRTSTRCPRRSSSSAGRAATCLPPPASSTPTRISPRSGAPSCRPRRCTAAERHNAFLRYDRTGPLVVFIVRGAKFQFHAPSDSFQDAVDDSVDLLEVLGPFFSRLEAAGLAGLVFALDPLARTPSEAGEEAVRSALIDWGLPLCCLPESHRDERWCQLAVERSADNLAHVPEPLRTRALCLQAVRQDGRALLHVPDALRDRTLCLTALQAGASLEHVPDVLRDRELCLEAMRRPYMLDHVPHALRDAEMCRRAFEGRQIFLFQVPRAFRDRELCHRAMEEDGSMLCFVPESSRDRELFLKAVTWGVSLRLAPLAMRDLELCTAAARADPVSLFLAPPELRAEIATAAGVDLNNDRVRALLTGLALVPFAERTPERWLREARENGAFLLSELAPDVLQDRETCLAIAAHGVSLEAVPEAFRTRE